jgi:hypothetical protein
VPPLRSLTLTLAAIALGACRSRPTSDDTAPSPTRRHVVDDTEERALPRAANGRDYLLYVAFPDSYAAHPERRYPVLYLCDGYWDFNLVKGFYGNLRYDKVLPELIIVGLGYQGDKPDYDRLRRWDLTPVADTRPAADRAGTGHATEFLSVLEHEIIPAVESSYRADPAYRVLGGSSLGGLFALYAMLARPGLFQAHIAPSPAVDWANDWLFAQEEAFARRGGKLAGRLFITGAEKESAPFLASIRRFDTVLRRRAYPDLAYEFRVVEGERHAGTKAESYNRGVRFAFAPRAPASE